MSHDIAFLKSVKVAYVIQSKGKGHDTHQVQCFSFK